jgi:hypothetical protein
MLFSSMELCDSALACRRYKSPSRSCQISSWGCLTDRSGCSACFACDRSAPRAARGRSPTTPGNKANAPSVRRVWVKFWSQIGDLGPTVLVELCPRLKPRLAGQLLLQIRPQSRRTLQLVLDSGRVPSPANRFSFAPSTQVFMENRNADTIQLDDRSSWIQLSFH